MSPLVFAPRSLTSSDDIHGIGELGVDFLQEELDNRIVVMGSLIACIGECTPNFGVVISGIKQEQTQERITPHTGLKLEQEPLAATLHLGN